MWAKLSASRFPAALFALALLPPGISAAGSAQLHGPLAAAEPHPAKELFACVTVTQRFETVPFFTAPIRDFGRFPFWEGRAVEGRTVLRLVTLENSFLRVDVAPDMGGAVAGAFHKPAGRDIFYREDAVKTRMPFWESGVKASFPYPEHGICTQDQPAGWVVVGSNAGPLTVAMWMEFSRNIGPQHVRFFGRYSPATLSQFVTLEPGTARVDIRYRTANPCLYKLARRVWNDAIFPRWEHGDTAARGTNGPALPDDARWISPVAWVSGHSGARLRRMTPEMRPLANSADSLFAWNRPFGFDGIYYPSSDVNRLRLSDPAEAPGAKLWWPAMPTNDSKGVRFSTLNIAEIWGGLDNVFEGAEDWLEPGEAAEMTLSYAMVAGIGEVQYADRLCAMARKPSPTGDVWSVVTFSPATSAVFRVAGSEVAGPCGPDRALSVAVPVGATNVPLFLSFAGNAVSNVFPLIIPDSTNGHGRIAEACAGPYTAERIGHAMDRGQHWASALGRAPEGSVQRGRLLCLFGKLEEAAAALTKAVEKTPGDGEGWHLLGAVSLERGRPAEAQSFFAKAVEAAEPYPFARLGLALAALARDDAAEAARHLDALIALRPANFTARSLRAWIAVRRGEKDALDRLNALEREDAADPRIAWLLAISRNGSRDRETLIRLTMEPGAASRLTEFQALTRGLYRHPARPL